MEKHTEQKIALDQSAWDCVKPASNASIDAAAKSLQALADAVKEWDGARKSLEGAKSGMDAEAMARTLEITSERLRNEANRRRAEADKYNEALVEKCKEVSRIHPALCGNMTALMPYATGAIYIADPVEYVEMCARRTFTPEITEANSGMIAAFSPVRRFAPDSEAIEPPEDAAVESISCLVASLRRHDAACRVLSDALEVCELSLCALSAEADFEAASVKEALARSGAADAPNGTTENQPTGKED